MTYRVVFSKRFRPDGNESSLDPTAELSVYLADGVVVERAFVERFEPEAKHSQEVIDEDDGFLGMASAEVWEYEVVNERSGEFEDAIRNSGTVMEFEVIDEGITDTSDVTATESEQTTVPTGSGGDASLDELTIKGVDDPSLGLTNRGDKGPQDWAADVGPTRAAEEASPDLVGQKNRRK